MKRLRTIAKACAIFAHHAPLYCFIHILITVISATKVYVMAMINKILINEFVCQMQKNNIKEGLLAIAQIIIFLFVVEFLYSSFSSVSKYWMSKYAMYYQDKMRFLFLRKISDIDVSFFDSPSQKNEMTQANKDVESMEALFKSVVALSIAAVSTIVSLSIIVRLNLILTIAIVISLIPSFFLRKKIQKDAYKLEKELNLTNRKVHYFVDLFNKNGVAFEMRLFNFSENIITKLKELFHYRNNKKLKLSRRNVALELFTLIVSGILNITYHLYIIYIILLQKLTLGDYNYYSSIAGNFKGSIEIILNNCSAIIINAEKMDSYLAFMEKPNLIKNGKQTLSKNTSHIIEFRNVSFTYPNTNCPVIKNLSFSISGGEKIALAGLNGAGKTTVIKLLLRFYDPTEGEIRCDGINIKNYDIDNYRTLFSASFQDGTTYDAMTLKENVAISNPKKDVDNLLIIQALNFSGLQLEEQNLGMIIGKQFDEEGLVLSKGQGQSLRIARSFYRECGISIFDEPASNLDAAKEQRLLDRIFSCATVDKSIVLISHRLSNLKKVDKIVFLENGTAVEIGSHEQLLSIKGRYHNLYHMQADRY